MEERAKALFRALSERDLKRARAQILAGIDINTRNGNGETPLHHLVKLGEGTETTKWFLFHGADVKARDPIRHQTPLHVAAGYGNREVVELLLSYGASLEAKNFLGETPLHMAAGHGDLEMVRSLLAHGAFLEARDAGGQTPLQKSLTPLIAERRNVETFEFLASQGANPFTRNDEGMTLLHSAAAAGNTRGAARLLDRYGLDLHARDKYGATPLHWAAVSDGSLKVLADSLSASDLIPKDGILDFLTAKGADLMARDAGGATPLHYAARFNSVGGVSFLLDRGVPVDAGDDNGATPLHYAMWKFPDAAALLVERGANIYARDREGSLPIHWAALGGSNFVKGFLRVFVEQGVPVNVCDFYGRTPLHEAALSGRLEKAFILLSLGADPGAKDGAGKTPLDLAREKLREQETQTGRRWFQDLVRLLELYEKRNKKAPRTRAEGRQPSKRLRGLDV